MQPELEKDVVAFERGIGSELAAPETFRRLLRGKRGDSALAGMCDVVARNSDGLLDLAAAAGPCHLRRFREHRGNSMLTTYTHIMDWQLDAAEVRVLGALMEKEAATPEYYPLSLNALVNACNQKSNREPVVSYDEETVEAALEGLRVKGLAMRVSGRESRVPKHEQRFTERFNLGRREAALMCVLMVRGPQTPGELRGRTDRLYTFDDLEAVESTLHKLVEMGFVKQLPRQIGYKEQRWAQLLAGDVEAAAPVAETQAAGDRGISDRERITALEREVADLRAEFEQFRKNFE
jgi:uncharacterized protein YceH (UPF0502 family)